MIPTRPFPQGGILTLEDLTASYIVTNDIQNSAHLNVDPYARSAVNKILKGKWDLLKCGDSLILRNHLLRPLMEIVEQNVFEEIEDSVLIDHILKEEEYACWIFNDIIEKGDRHLLKTTIKKLMPVIATQDRELLLEERVNQLFQQLAETLQVEELFGDVIPADFSSYEYACLDQNTGGTETSRGIILDLFEVLYKANLDPTCNIF